MAISLGQREGLEELGITVQEVQEGLVAQEGEPTPVNLEPPLQSAVAAVAAVVV